MLVLLGMVGKVPAAVKRLPMALFAPLKDSLYKLLQPKFHYEYLVRYLVSDVVIDNTGSRRSSCHRPVAELINLPVFGVAPPCADSNLTVEWKPPEMQANKYDPT